MTDLSSYRSWLYRLANDMLWADSSARNTLTVDDLVQEGMIAMWRALEKFDPARGRESAHLTNAARVRMLDILSGKKPTFGTEGNRGRVKVPESALTPLPEPGSPYEPIAEPMMAPGASELVERALAAMPEASRDYVERVFWGGERLRRDRAAWRDAEETFRRIAA